MKYVPVSTINRQLQKTVWVVDNFYSDPYAVRDYALRQEFKPEIQYFKGCLLYTSPSPRDLSTSRMPSSA